MAGWLASQVRMWETLSFYGGLAITDVLSSKIKDECSIFALAQVCGGIVMIMIMYC